MSRMTKELLKQRRTGIGGSDVAAIFGLSAYMTDFELYRDKRGQTPLEDEKEDENREWGNRLEPLLRQHYSDQTGLVIRDPGMVRSERYPWMLANMDGVTDCPRVVEVKKSRTGRDYGADGTDEVPVSCMLQVQHYMIVTGFDVADVVALLWGSSFRVYHVEADSEIQERIIEETQDFWQRIQDGDPPEPTTTAAARQRWTTASTDDVVASADIAAVVARSKRIRAAIKRLKTMHDILDAQAMSVMGEATTLLDVDRRKLVTWNQTKGRVTFDRAALGRDHPELLDKYTKTGNPGRSFLIK